MNMNNPKIAFFGTGAVGCTVGGWVAGSYDNVSVFDRKEILDVIRKNGITTYLGGDESSRKTVKVKVIDDIKKLADADVIAIAVKNYSLDAVCAQLKKVCGDKPVIIGMQNGAENQRIIPKYFSKVIFCVIGYNAWVDSPGVAGYQKKGPLVLGTAKNELPAETAAIGAIWNRGVETVVVDHLQDAVHSKIIVNLTNSLTTLIGLGFREVTDYPAFQRMLSCMLWEGVRIVKAAGYHECKIGGMPPWLLMHASASLPGFLTRPLFKKNIRKLPISSMAQDIIKRGSRDSELDTINGYVLSLAEKTGVKAPYNRAIYEICKREFARDKFTPLAIEAVSAEVAKYL